MAKATQTVGAVNMIQEAIEYPSFLFNDRQSFFGESQSDVDFFQSSAAQQQVNNNHVINSVMIFSGAALLAFVMGGR